VSVADRSEAGERGVVGQELGVLVGQVVEGGGGVSGCSRRAPLATALAEYGRIVRTNFLLAYGADPQLRSRITGQLNKGETLHALRRHLVIGSRAQLPADEDDRHRHALCLQVLVNAVVWGELFFRRL
jgi:TnpA family transposase